MKKYDVVVVAKYRVVVKIVLPHNKKPYPAKVGLQLLRPSAEIWRRCPLISLEV